MGKKQKILKVILTNVFLTLLFCEFILQFSSFYLIRKASNSISIIPHKSVIKILALGESTTAFGGPHSYPSQLEKLLNLEFKKTKFQVINVGQPGASSQELIQRLPEFLNDYKPDIILTMMGINDFWSSDFNKSKIRVLNLIKMAWINFKIQFSQKSPSQGDFIEKNLLKKATLALSKNKYRESMQFYLQYFKSKKQFEEALELLRQFYTSLESKSFEGDQRFFISIFEMTKKLNPQDPRPFEIASEFYFNLLRKGKAKPFLINKVLNYSYQAINLGSKNSFTFLNLARLFHTKGEIKKAYQYFERAIKLEDPKNPWVFEDYADVLLKQNEIVKAFKIAKKGIRKFPRYKGLQRVFKESCKNEKRCQVAASSNHYLSNPKTIQSYQKLIQLARSKSITPIIMGYPLTSLSPLEGSPIFSKIIKIKNIENFNEHLKDKNYQEIFTDNFAGHFGHATSFGNYLIAQNALNVIKKIYSDPE